MTMRQITTELGETLNIQTSIFDRLVAESRLDSGCDIDRELTVEQEAEIRVFLVALLTMPREHLASLYFAQRADAASKATKN